MEDRNFSNDFCFSGEVVRKQEFPEEKRKEFYGTITVKGKSENNDNAYPTVCELVIYLRKNGWEDFERKKKLYDYAELCGHMEQTATRNNPIKFVGDLIVA